MILIKKEIAKSMVTVLNKVLKVEANSTSCILAYQPKEPKTLDRFKKTR
ncbi:MAG: cyclic lactone autoinducer peptide [Lachnospiraceae bacterium]